MVKVRCHTFAPGAAVGAPGSFQFLRQCIQNVLYQYMSLPPPVIGANSWRSRGISIAFELVGSGTLGYRTDDAAEHVLAAIQGWYHDRYLAPGPPVCSQSRRYIS